MNKWLSVILLAVALLTGFVVGRLTQSTEIRYVKQHPVSGSVVPPFEYKEIEVADPILPYKYIYFTDTIIEVVDTSAIIKDYAAKREYDFTVFDDVYGKLDLKPTLQYNKLQKLDYTFTPITQVKIREDIFNIFATMGYATNETAILGGGLYYKKIGVEYNYNIRLRQHIGMSDNYHTFKIHYKL